MHAYRTLKQLIRFTISQSTLTHACTDFDGSSIYVCATAQSPYGSIYTYAIPLTIHIYIFHIYYADITVSSFVSISKFIYKKKKKCQNSLKNTSKTHSFVFRLKWIEKETHCAFVNSILSRRINLQFCGLFVFTQPFFSCFLWVCALKRFSHFIRNYRV